MHPCREPRVFEMGIDHIAEQHAVCLDGALVPERGVLLCPAAFGVGHVPPLEVRLGGAGMCVVLSCRDEQMEVGLMCRAVQRLWIVEGVGDRQPGPGNLVHQVTHEAHVLSQGQLVRERDLPLLERDAAPSCIVGRQPLALLSRTKVGVRIALSPRGEIARVFVHEVLAVLMDDVALLLHVGAVVRLARNILDPCGRFAPTTFVHGSL